MKNLITSNVVKKGRHNEEYASKIVKAQIDNSFELGWKRNELILITNYDFEYRKVKALNLSLNDFCLTGSKMFSVQWCFRYGGVNELIWAHDLDSWQNCEFFYPDRDLHLNPLGDAWDAAATYYSKPKFNGGSVFWKPAALDIIDDIVNVITTDNKMREEPTIQKIFTDAKYKERIAILDNSYNVGCSGFVPRYNRSTKPIKVCHLHPTNRLAWQTHALDRNGQGFRSVSPRLEHLLRSYWPMAIEMTPDGEKKAKKIRWARIKELKKETYKIETKTEEK